MNICSWRRVWSLAPALVVGLAVGFYAPVPLAAGILLLFGALLAGSAFFVGCGLYVLNRSHE